MAAIYNKLIIRKLSSGKSPYLSEIQQKKKKRQMVLHVKLKIHGYKFNSPEYFRRVHCIDFVTWRRFFFFSVFNLE